MVSKARLLRQQAAKNPQFLKDAVDAKIRAFWVRAEREATELGMPQASAEFRARINELPKKKEVADEPEFNA